MQTRIYVYFFLTAINAVVSCDPIFCLLFIHQENVDLSLKICLNGFFSIFSYPYFEYERLNNRKKIKFSSRDNQVKIQPMYR